MPRAHFLWQAQCFVDLDKKVAETQENVVFDLFNLIFPWRAQCFVKI